MNSLASSHKALGSNQPFRLFIIYNDLLSWMDQTVFLISLLTPVIVVLLTTFATFLFEMMCTVIVPTDKVRYD